MFPWELENLLKAFSIPDVHFSGGYPFSKYSTYDISLYKSSCLGRPANFGIFLHCLNSSNQALCWLDSGLAFHIRTIISAPEYSASRQGRWNHLGCALTFYMPTPAGVAPSLSGNRDLHFPQRGKS